MMTLHIPRWLIGLVAAVLVFCAADAVLSVVLHVAALGPWDRGFWAGVLAAATVYLAGRWFMHEAAP